MLKVNIICVGKLKEVFWRQACAEYSKRLQSFCDFTITELDEARIPKSCSDADIQRALEGEGRRMLYKIPNGGFVAAMCIEGREFSSEQLAEKIESIAVCGKNRISFLIGSSYGLSDEVKAAADLRLSMSPMTFPHQLARVMLCEQIYRAFSINASAKYHK